MGGLERESDRTSLTNLAHIRICIMPNFGVEKILNVRVGDIICVTSNNHIQYKFNIL